jgi:hypothetical protein
MPLRRTLTVVTLLVAAACGSDGGQGPAPPARSYYMGFSDFPPAPDTMSSRRTIELWISRADAAIMHLEVPWIALLAGGSSDSLVLADVMPLVNAYRTLGFAVVIETDVTNPIDRTAESPALVMAGRSLTQDSVQLAYRRYIVSLATIAAPMYLGLASETNLIRGAAPAGVYAAVVQMTNDAARDVRDAGSFTKLYVSVQVEVAWGLLAHGSAGSFVGIDQDRADFPFIGALGLSSYPYLGGFADPADVPDDYFSRLAGDELPPVLAVEGGWSSANIGTVHSTPAKQAAWIRRAAALLDRAHAVAWFQLDFADLDLAAFGLSPDDPQVAPFAEIGLVDTTLTPKPSLAMWDSVFALPLTQRLTSRVASVERAGARVAGRGLAVAHP